MTARPNLSSIPAAGITIDGIVDVLGGKSIVVGRLVGDTNDDALKGQVLVLDGAGKVATADTDATLANFAGVAVSSAVKGDIISVLRHGIARMVVDENSTALAVGDEVAVYGAGKVCKVGDNSTSNAIGYVASISEGYVPSITDAYVDVEVNKLGAAV